MPHFKCLKFNPPQMPHCADLTGFGNFKIWDIFESLKEPQNSLIAVNFIESNFLDSIESIKSTPKNIEFFLEKKPTKINQNSKKEPKIGTLVRFHKHTRAKPISIVKNALKILSELQSEILVQNLDGKELPTNTRSPWIWEALEFIDFIDFIESKKTDSIKNNHKISTQSPKITRKDIESNLAQIAQNPDFSVVFEIGFGSGRNILDLAKNHQNTLFIGAEVHTPSIEQVARLCGLLNLKNIILLNTDARAFLELLPNCFLQKIYLHFPIPWPNEPHRRVFCENFLNSALRVLQKNGILELRSDDLSYFEYSLQIAQNAAIKGLCEIISQKNQHKEIISKYEARWLRQNKDIYTLQIRKEKDFGAFFKEQICPPKLNKEQFLQIPKKLDEILALKVRERGIFARVCNIYKSTQNPHSLLFALAFGECNCPQNHYLIFTLNENEANSRFFQKNPLAISSNKIALNALFCAICEILNKDMF